MIISASLDSESLDPAVGSTCRAPSAHNALVLREEPSTAGPVLKPINKIDLKRLAAQATPRRRAA